MRERTRRTITVVLAGAGLPLIAIYGLYRCYYYYYPFGMEHRCDKCLWMELHSYAEQHDGMFPSGGKTPEASLCLLGREYSQLLHHRSVPTEVVDRMFERGEPLDGKTCGWSYVEGLGLKSNPELALFWDKEGLDENGGRMSGGGHNVSFIGTPYVHVPASRWERFLEEQRKLLAKERAKTRKAGN
jgi:hypothetical protein